MTREEFETLIALNHAAAALKPAIDADYPPGRFVAVFGGKIVADDADFDALQVKLDALGIGRFDALIVRAGDPVPGRAVFPGMMTLTAMGRALWSFETRTAG